MLKIKSEVGYRPTSLQDRHSGRCCGTCESFRPKSPIYRIGGELKGHEPRCTVIGLDNSVKYRVKRDYVCKRHEFEPHH